MEFKIQKKDFLRGLERTLTVVERRNTMPSLNHALCELKDNSLQVSATDLEIFVSSTVPCKALTVGRIALPARNVFDIVKECEDSEIHVRALDSNRIEIISGKSQFKILGLAADTFPHFKASPKGQLTTGRLNCREFVKLIAKTEYAVCTEEIRYFLTGIYLETHNEGKGSHIRAVATDGHRMAVMDAAQSSIGSLELKKSLIVPKKGAAELRKLLESTTEETFEISCDENLLRARVGDFHLWVRPIDGEYPDYKRVMPSNLPSTLTISRKELATSLRRMNLLVSDRSRVVIFEFKKNKVVLSTNNPDLGEASDEVSASYDGQEYKTGFNVRFFLDAMNYLEGDQIEIKLGEKLQPALVTSTENPGYQVVVMPMRI
jgi:DNA polymerase III subunit beta